jgi:hypothetical protein
VSDIPIKGGVHEEWTQGGMGRLTEGIIKRENKCRIVTMKEGKQRRKRTMMDDEMKLHSNGKTR